MVTGYITHEESMIRVFMRDPEFAEFYLAEIKKDGDEDEIQCTERRIAEAKARLLAKAVG